MDKSVRNWTKCATCTIVSEIDGFALVHILEWEMLMGGRYMSICTYVYMFIYTGINILMKISYLKIFYNIIMCWQNSSKTYKIYEIV